ncbi:MAG: methyltransferase domain-containing protein [Pseudomonadota bacterium]
MVDANPNQDQEDFWSEKPGLTWSENDGIMDSTLAPVLDHLLEAAALQPGETVLDIGCGTGLSTLKAAEAVAPGGRSVGADIAEQMLVKARSQAAGFANVEFLRADAQIHGFEDASFDAVISRFGVMFFADPAAAFANIARAVKPGGRMVFMTWSGITENPWFMVPRDIAIARLGAVEPTPPNAPGPMGLADREYTADLFSKAGLNDVQISPVTMDLTPPGTAEWMGEFALTLGPASRIFAERDGSDEDAKAIISGVAAQYRKYETDAGLRIPAVLNRVEVRL